ncbi:MAG TPA: YbhB/YbcL family Raf kinase inhibitor-like protein [Telluria sp.]|nr:YbhB/YbcL family Raf kinase inhibitor-like protein [Telluria sp.]
MSLTITSEAFGAGASIPAQYTCDGSDVSPPLSWTGVPAGTKSLALIVDDPDAPDPAAPQRTWVHWVLYNIPADATGLPAGVKPEQLPAGTRIGQNDWKKAAYGGPCPPIGRHRYLFKLYALNEVLSELGPVTKAHLEKAIDDFVIEKAELIGTYER